MLALGCGALGLAAGLLGAFVVSRVPDPAPLPVSVRLAVVLVTAALFVAAALRFGLRAELPIYLFLFASLVAVSAIDLRVSRLPNVIVAPTLLVAALGMVVVSFGRDDWGPMGRALLGAALYFVLLLVPHLVNPRGMGFGDVKLGTILGLAVGWLAPGVTGVITLVFVAAVLGMGLGVVLGLAFRAGWRAQFPLGPALAAGAIAVILASESLVAS